MLDMSRYNSLIFKSNSVPKKILFGYEDQMKAGLALGSFVAEGNFKSALVFGYPGTGKEAFPLALTNELNKRRYHFSFLKIHCERVLKDLGNPEEVEKRLLQWNKGIAENTPIVVALDELECLSFEKIHDSFASLILYSWILSLLGNQSGGVFVIGIADCPQKIDKSLVAKFGVALYFDITSEDTVSRIISYYLDVPRPKVIASMLIAQLNLFKVSPLSSEIIIACSHLENMDLSNLSDESVVGLIRRNLTPSASIESIVKYRLENEALIEISEDYTIPYWSEMAVVGSS